MPIRPLSILALAALVACGGSTAATTAPTPTSTGPLYAIATQVIGQTSTTYVALVDDLDRAADVPLESAVEIAGRAIAVGPTKGGLLFTGSNESPEITRWTLSPSGTLDRGASVSFARYGVSEVFAYPEQFHFVSETKAYYLEDATLQLFVWNPSTMTIEKVVPLDGLARAGWTMTFGIAAVLRGDELIVVSSYYKPNDEIYDKETRIAFIDTKTDAVAATITETRCSYLGHSVVGPSGEVYLGSEVYTAAVERAIGATHGGPSCAVRIPAGQRATDPGYLFDFAASAGKPAGSLLPAGGSEAFVRVLDEGLLPERKLSPRELFGGAYWRWAKTDLARPDAQTTLLADLPPGPSSILLYKVDGRVLTNESAADYSSTTLLDLSHATGPRRGAKIRGVPFGIVRVR
jgi:hypothetical protein